MRIILVIKVLLSYSDDNSHNIVDIILMSD